ncbi:putative sulfite oxidase subunit YedZ [Slackia heliotrinireducens]|uniref:Predicted membrane protein n=1 Tax=Slackia heliotrinireducens (strain ATCC 29202 / DSM 20476 / NCTC 11029 / RHS 1) TaxID=471855 RepID=C7N7C3_SLAHD|nr:ferric reductase-like transmembrane domain-containing protein [Slackia heliotrinireducens]ACV22808.1 predicted membrane protein [Slackia heliotrinireducens DSM 20476]VEH01518.1 putative sulfite oxidase subunit YedZ [Slackia heliotrinireducens]
MSFAIVLAVTVACVFVLRNAIMKCPAAFYALSVAAVAALLAGVNGMLPVATLRPLVLVVQRCMVALALFVVVMFIGVLPRGSKPDLWLRPIRAELSIIACILALGHMFQYLLPYARSAFGGALPTSTMVSFVVACVLFVLLTVLGVTSFRTVKRRMSGRVWKNVQRFAYLFYGLIYLHLMFMLAPAAMRGGHQALASVVVYSVVFAAYTILRVMRYLLDKRAR